MESQHTSLTRPGKVPRLVMARSLDQASSGSFMYVDRHGDVRSPARFRAMQAVGYLSMAGAAALPVLYGLALGPIGAGAGLALSGFFGARIRNTLRVQRAALLMSHSRLDEAAALLESVIHARFVSRDSRTAAYLNLATCTAMRGDHEAALALARKARGLIAGKARRSIHGPLTAYLEIKLLSELGRTREARAALDALGPAPSGEYLRVAHWTAELHVCMAEGRCTLDDDELHVRARKALAMTTGSRLLGLVAWAFAERGNHEMATHAIIEAFDRLDNDRLERMMPRLYEWMCAYRAERPAEDSTDSI